MYIHTYVHTHDNAGKRGVRGPEGAPGVQGTDGPEVNFSACVHAYIFKHMLNELQGTGGPDVHISFSRVREWLFFAFGGNGQRVLDFVLGLCGC
jgi:hypothetical protein